MRFRVLAAMAALLACIPAFAADKIVLGKLGQSLQNVRIYSRPSYRSHVYYQVKPYTYLVIRPARSASFYQVLLQTGAWGYVPADYVAKLPYNVTADQPTQPTFSARSYEALGSRGARATAAAESLQHLGVPYRWGGTNINSGIDCSAFVRYLYGQVGLSLPRTAAEQALVGIPVTRLQDLRAGDRLYFWSYKRNMIGHTGIYLGNGYFCNSEGGHGVVTSYLGDKKWRDILVAARR